jgi:hypothetical protein
VLKTVNTAAAYCTGLMARSNQSNHQTCNQPGLTASTPCT